MKPLFLFSILFGLLAGCRQGPSVTNSNDYAIYLEPGRAGQALHRQLTELSFWEQRLARDTGNYVDMLELAARCTELYRLQGDVRLLNRADSLLRRSSAKLGHKDPEILFSLAQHSITLHRFREAASFAEAAEKAGGDLYLVRLLQFDAAMELGQYGKARQSLQSLRNTSTFDYAIRKAKWEDHSGNPEGAISVMEEALLKVKGKNQSLYLWGLSNLADMYGHAGRIRDAYAAYLSVLKEDPLNYHCLRGIAWIAYANDGKSAEATRIVNYLLSQAEIPELRLLLAEMAEAEGHSQEQWQQLRAFESAVTRPAYGNMYAKYLAELYAGPLLEPGKAVAVAEAEWKHRFTPETCDGMAWAYYRNGELDKALQITRKFVYGKTYEPGILLRSGIIFAAAGQKKEARELLEACAGSSFELGPAASREAREQLEAL